MPSCTLQILTPSGEFKNFSGVQRARHFKCIELTLDSGKTLRTSVEHKFMINGETVKFANTIVVGDQLIAEDSGTRVNIVNLVNLPDGEWFYDPIEVSDGAVYIHDGNIVSHNTFIGNTTNLLSSEALLSLRAADPVKYHNGVKFFEEPREDCNYIAMVDVSRGRGQDYSTVTVVNASVNPFKQVATFRNNMISPLVLPDVVVRVAKIYNEAVILIESNDAGQVVCNAIYYEYEYENVFVESSVKAGGIGVTMNKRVKREGCSNLKDLIEAGKLEIVDADCIEELGSFEADGTSYAAAQGCHDDLVMNLVLFAWFVASTAFKSISNIDLRNMLFAERLREMEEDVPFVGFFPKEDAHSGLSEAFQEMIRAKKEWSIL